MPLLTDTKESTLGEGTAALRRAPLGPEECRVLADALGDAPETVREVHQLRRGLCRAYVAGGPSDFEGAIIQVVLNPGELAGFGTDPEVLWDLLQSVDDWTCVDVAPSVAPRLGAIIREATGKRVCYYRDVYHTLSKPAISFRNDVVRQLTITDLPLLEAAPAEIRGAGFGSPGTMLAVGFAAGAIVSGRLVAIAHTSALTRHHADISAFTLEPWRRRGFSTAAASIVAERVQETGRTPVWSAGEDNIASLRVAEKVGFEEVSRLTFVIMGDKG